MTQRVSTGAPETAKSNQRLPILLAMAMFVLVVDTSLMNVSISAVVKDLDTTVSGVQGAIALEALVSAAFILIGGKTGDLIGRKLAYVLGLLGYAVGAIAMTLAQGLTAIIVFWAVIGGIGASLLLPAMQSLIHGNFEGAHQKRVYALVGASAAIAAAVGPLLGGFITTFLSWRVGFLLEAVIIAVVLSGIKLVHDVPYEGSRAVGWVGAAILLGFTLLVVGLVALVLVAPRADTGCWLTIPRVVAGCGLGMLVSQLNNYTLSPISDERVSEAADVNSAAGSFGLSFGLAFAGAIMLAVLSTTFTNAAQDSNVLSPAEQQRVADVLDKDAQLMSDAALEQLL